MAWLSCVGANSVQQLPVLTTRQKLCENPAQTNPDYCNQPSKSERKFTYITFQTSKSKAYSVPGDRLLTFQSQYLGQEEHTKTHRFSVCENRNMMVCQGHIALITTAIRRMCTQDYRLYTCGCRKLEEFRQCLARQGTNEKCAPVTQNRLDDSSHMCSKHLIVPGKDRMHR